MTELSRSIASNDRFEESDQLVVRLKAGEETAFAEAFHLYRDFIYTLSFKLLGDKAESWDVTQEVFLTLFRKIAGFREQCSLKTWLYRVAINQAANRNRWWKRRFRQRTLSLGLSSGNAIRGLDLPSPSPSPAQQCLSQEIREALQESLRELPFEQRVAVTLRDVEGLSYEEIAEVTGARIGTVKSRIARGRERLRVLLRRFREGSAS